MSTCPRSDTNKRWSTVLFAISLGLCHACGPKQPEPIGSEHSQRTNNTTAENNTSKPAVTPPNALPGGDGIAGCAPWQQTDDLKVCVSSYLGGDGEEEAASILILPDGAILMAGSISDPRDFGPSPREFFDGGPALITRLSPDGKEIEGWSRVGDTITAMEASPDGETVIVSGSFGAISISPDLQEILWNTRLNAANALAVAADGTSAHLTGKTVTILSPTGAGAGSFTIDASFVEDVAISSETGLVYVTGFKQVGGNLQQPYIHAYTWEGALEWSAYDWEETTASDFGSDTRGYVISMGLDGMLYFAGEAHGGATVFNKDPWDLSTDANNITYDDHSRTHDHNGAAPIGYFARFDPRSGEHLAGQFLVTRLSSGKGNAARIRHIEAREDGVVLLGGQSSCCIPGADSKTIEGQKAMPDYAGGAFVMATDPDFASRLFWTTFSGDATGVEIASVAIRGESMAMLELHGADKETPGALTGRCIEHDPIQNDPAGGESELHFAVWPGPAMVEKAPE
jgi:hypothetical protein